MTWILRLLVLSGCAGAAFPATAADRALSYSDRPLDFSLQFAEHKIDIAYPGATVATSVKRVGIVWRERYGRRVQLGLLGGYAFLSQTDNPATAGIEPKGYYAGVSLYLDLYAAEPIDVFLSTAYLYQHVDHESAAQSVDLTWREPNIQLGAGVKLGNRVRAYGGLVYASVDGTQRQSGAVNETRGIESAGRTSGFGGLELGLDGDDYVGVVAASGTNRSAGLYFGRRF